MERQRHLQGRLAVSRHVEAKWLHRVLLWSHGQWRPLGLWNETNTTFHIHAHIISHTNLLSNGKIKHEECLNFCQKNYYGHT